MKVTRGSTATTAFRPTGAWATPIPHTPINPADVPDPSLLAGPKVTAGKAGVGIGAGSSSQSPSPGPGSARPAVPSKPDLEG